MIIRRAGGRGSTHHSGWASARPRRVDRLRGAASLLLALPLVLGLVGLPANAPAARGDELSDAKARQEALKKEVDEQKEAVAALRSLQQGLAAEIAQTRAQLNGINADLAKVKSRIVKMTARIKEVTEQKTAREALVLPVLAQAARRAPAMRAWVKAAVMPLSLKLPDGFIPSYCRKSRPGSMPT